ncbi:3-deoxy-D-manno-octulosonate 8-phosphate phosphatase [hydrothermal vent metagenome]|uniref:3-deoxy-D-manno-octulosonate 8-phosphate phosphatase n=1 Tax=hydrothermal vent metagenome TaxID=652676 RepID=A0A3B1A5F2_9ZZZZ
MNELSQVQQQAAKIKLVIFDVDGVLTNGGLFIGDDGQEYKAFHSRDGLGMAMLQKTNVQIAIITARSSNVVKHRMASLGIKYVYQGRKQKLPAFKELLSESGFQAEQVAYVGDDLVDLPVLRKVGLAIAVADAHPFVTKHVHWQTESKGGVGAARDVCEMIMQAQGTLEQQYASFL